MTRSKYHHCLSNGRGVMVQKSFFHRRTYRQTDMTKQVYLHNFVGGGLQTYSQCGEIVANGFHGGSHFFTTFGSQFKVRI